MDTLEAIYQRRAVKGFDPNHKITEDDEKKLLEATIQAPTSFNIQHWRFVILRDTELRQKIQKELGFEQAQMTDASLLILFTGDMKAWRKDVERYWENAPEEVSNMMVGMTDNFYKDREWLQRDEAQRSIGMAMQTLMLAAKAMGYDSCPMIGFNIEELAKLINLPEDHVMGPMVAIGKKVKEPWPKPGQLSLKELKFENEFPK